MRPFSKRRTKTSRTALERPGSRVKRSRLQSQLAPRRIIWRLIWSPYCAFHSHTRSMNLSRPMVRRSRPSSASLRSTTICVAMPAWSVPGSHRVLSPRMRCQRMVTSISACSSMWPMWSEPVTLGGGMTREKTRGRAFWEAWKTPESIHHCAQCGSNRCGSENFSICMGSTMISSRAGWDSHSAACRGRTTRVHACALHRDSRPSFYVNRRKDVFYCHGCGQGGDVVRLAELLHGLSFQRALATLMGPEEGNGGRLWSDACDFYRHQLRRSLEAQSY